MLFEIIVKLLGVGVNLYFKDKFNMFDFTILIVNLADIAIEQAYYKNRYQVLKTFRILRLFKIAKSWSSLKNLFTIIYQTMADLSAFGILCLTFILTYTIAGMEWFAYTLK